MSPCWLRTTAPQGRMCATGTANKPAAVGVPLVGRISNGALDLQPAKGLAVSGALSGSDVSGEITMAGTSHRFLASRAAPPAGMCQASDNDSACINSSTSRQGDRAVTRRLGVAGDPG
jgi:hypothetical protein